jgi:uncharacterized protein (DUF1778 family)
LAGVPKDNLECRTEQYRQFSEALDAPAQPSEMLQELLFRKAPWEK